MALLVPCAADRAWRQGLGCHEIIVSLYLCIQFLTGARLSCPAVSAKNNASLRGTARPGTVFRASLQRPAKPRIGTMLPFAPPSPDAAQTSAHEEAYRHLSHGIRMGILRPGDRLVADDVAQSLGMSRMPVREALRQLAAEGLLVMPPNRGAVVRELSEDEVIEVFEMRAVLEGLAASMASRRCTRADIDDLQDLLAAMQRCEGQLSEWITVHRRFHERLCQTSAAPRLTGQISALHSVVEPLMRIWLESNTPSPRLQQHHERLLASLQAGDPDRAEREVRSHVRGTVDSLTQAMRAGRAPRGKGKSGA